MRRRWKLSACSIVLAILLNGCGNPEPASSSATLSTDTLVFDSDRSGNHEIFVMKSNGSQATQLTRDAAFENWWPRISPDRKKILFYRAPRAKSEAYDLASL